MIFSMREKLALAIEDFIVDLIYAIAAIPQRFVTLIAEVGQIFVGSFNVTAHGRDEFEAEISNLIAPHLPVLAHKRAKMYVATDDAAVERWSLELHCFMERSLMPLLGQDRDFAERNRSLVATLLDRTIEREQNKAAASASEDFLPRVTRFESSWVA